MKGLKTLLNLISAGGLVAMMWIIAFMAHLKYSIDYAWYKMAAAWIAFIAVGFMSAVTAAASDRVK